MFFFSFEQLMARRKGEQKEEVENGREGEMRAEGSLEGE
jgi:hypothetical protein